jgi:hypothetical protein
MVGRGRQTMLNCVTMFTFSSALTTEVLTLLSDGLC